MTSGGINAIVEAKERYQSLASRLSVVVDSANTLACQVVRERCGRPKVESAPPTEDLGV